MTLAAGILIGGIVALGTIFAHREYTDWHQNRKVKASRRAGL